MPRPKLRFFSDNNVPDPVGRFLREEGHDVEFQRDHIPVDAPDPVVGIAAIESERILISWDKDFNHQRFMKERFSGLSRIGMSCPEPMAVQRLEAVLDIVEFAVQRAQGAPVLIRIGRDKVAIRC